MRRWLWLLLAAQLFGNTGAVPFWTPYHRNTPMHLWLTVYGEPVGETGVDWEAAPTKVEFLDAPDSTQVCMVPSPCVTLGELRWWAAARAK